MSPKKASSIERERKARTETLASTSQAGLNNLLNRGLSFRTPNEERKKDEILKKAALAAGFALPPATRTVVVDDCGAPACVRDDVGSEQEGEDDDELEWEEDESEMDVDASQSEPVFEVVMDAEAPKGQNRGGKADKAHCQMLHRTHLLCLLARGLLVDRAVNDHLVQCMMISAVPRDLHVLQAASDMEADLDNLGKLVAWFKGTFTVKAEDRATKESDGDSAQNLEEFLTRKLLSVFEKRQGSAGELSALFAALLRGQGRLARLIRVLDPLPLRPGVSKKQKASRASLLKSSQKQSQTRSNPRRRKRKKDAGSKAEGPKEGEESTRSACDEKPTPVSKRRKGDEEFERQMQMAMEATAVEHEARMGDTHSLEQDQATKQKAGVLGKGSQMLKLGTAWSGASDLCCHWCELWCGSEAEGKWVHVDPITGWMNRCDDVEDGAVRSRPFSYVVGFSGGGAKDVTRRYAADFVTCQSQRDEEWWEKTIAPYRCLELQKALQNREAGNKTEECRDVAGLRVAREDAELDERVISQRKNVPRTIEEFKRSPMYVLERHLSKYQGLVPGAVKLGMHRGEAYFLREHIVELRSANMWIREGRVVLEEELSKPYKTVKKRGTASNRNDEKVVDDAASVTSLYGPWQTSPWERPVATGGIVPKSEYGNVEVPPLVPALPEGTVHLPYPRIVRICQEIGIDFAPALVGFDRVKGNKSMPRTEGVVVCKEHESTVMTLYLQQETEREQAIQEKRKKMAQAMWRNLLGAVWTRLALSKSYEGNVKEDPILRGEEAADDVSNGIIREEADAYEGLDIDVEEI